MKLVGQLDSPFVRRAAIALHHGGLSFEFAQLSVFANFEEILSLSPIGRVPLLIVGPREVLFDSQGIVDYAEAMAPAERRLMPTDELERRTAQRVEAIAIGVMEKSVDLRLETLHKSAEARDLLWKERLERQIQSGLAWLEQLRPSPWLCGGRLTRADVSVAVAYTNLRFKFPNLLASGQYSNLARHCAQAESLPSFEAAAYPA
jgi:glutathione S-transferase